MEKTDNMTCDLETDFDFKRFTLLQDFSKILSVLTKASEKISVKLYDSSSLISKLVSSIQFGDLVNDQSFVKLYAKQSEDALSKNSVCSEIEPEISDSLPKWNEIQTSLESIGSEFMKFSEKLGEISNSIVNFKDTEVDQSRVPLPTEVNGRRLCLDSFMKVLRYYPVPFWSKRKEEIKLRRRLIMSHYEHSSAIRFLNELKNHNGDNELEALISTAKIRVKTTREILEFYTEELIRFHESYRDFMNEYRIALVAPEMEEQLPEGYLKSFNKMISRARKSQTSKNLERMGQVALFKKSTYELEEILKELVSSIGKGSQ